MFHGCLSNFAFPLSSKAHPRPRSMKKTWIQAIRDKRRYLIVDLSKLVEAVDESVLYIYTRIEFASKFDSVSIFFFFVRFIVSWLYVQSIYILYSNLYNI